MHTHTVSAAICLRLNGRIVINWMLCVCFAGSESFKIGQNETWLRFMFKEEKPSIYQCDSLPFFCSPWLKPFWEKYIVKKLQSIRRVSATRRLFLLAHCYSPLDWRGFIFIFFSFADFFCFVFAIQNRIINATEFSNEQLTAAVFDDHARFFFVHQNRVNLNFKLVL